jgi:hypothetical protein
MTIPGYPYQNPLNYTGNKVNLVPIAIFYREPTVNDKKYRIGTVIIIGKDPVNGSQGDLWYLANFDSSGDAIWLQLLTGAASPGIDSITTDDGAPPVDPDGNGNVNIVGGIGCTVTGQGPGDTVTIDVMAGGFDFELIQTATHTIETGHGYFADRGAGVTFTMPATANVGDRFIVTTVNAGGFTINENAGQDIRIGSAITTVTTGSLASTAIGDCLEIVCYIQDTNFLVLDSMGNITVV